MVIIIVIEFAMRSADASRQPPVNNWDVPDAEGAGNARDATTQHTKTRPIFASTILRLSDTQN